MADRPAERIEMLTRAGSAAVTDEILAEFGEERLLYVRMEPDPDDPRLVTVVFRRPDAD